MDLGKLANKELSLNVARDLLGRGEPLVVRVERVLSVEEIEASLLVDALRTPAGTKVAIRQAPGVTGRNSLATVVMGSDKVSPSRVGDVVAFSAAYEENGIALVGHASAREHDGLEGPTQVMTAMARASQSRSTKKGASQYLTITDGSAASIAATVDQVVATLREAATRKWPGGNAGLIMRDVQGNAFEFFLGYDSDENYLADELRHHGTLDNGKLELIPAWRVPMGRDQLMREIDPRKGETKAHSGSVTRMFEHETLRGKQGFVPCLIVTGDEDEWSFGAKTGKRHRVIAGVQPIMGRVPVAAERLPSAVRKYGGHPNGILSLHDDATMERLASARAARRPEKPREERAAPQAPGREERDDERPRNRGIPQGFRLGR